MVGAAADEGDVDSALRCLNCRSSPISPNGLVLLLLHYRLNKNRRGVGSIAPVMPSVLSLCS